MSRRVLGRLALLTASCAFVALLMASAELILRAVGAGATRQHDPFAGFSNVTPMFEPAVHHDGTPVMRTAAARFTRSREEFLAHKPADGFRAFVVGGSSAAGFPFTYRYSFSGWLQRRLEAELPERTVEVVNAAVDGYGSRRILAVTREIARYEPDLLIIYLGHNEVTERRYYAHLLDLDPRLFRLWVALTSTRLYGVLSRWTRQDPRVRAREIPFDDLAPGREMFAVGKDRVTRQSPEEVEQELAYAELHYRFNLEQMIRVMHEVEARVLILSISQNFADWSPGLSRHRPGLTESELERWTKWFQEGERLAPESCPTAMNAWRRALAIDGEVADLHFRIANCARTLEDWDMARRHYQLASDFDIVPHGAPTRYNQILREMALEHGTLFIDVAELLERESPWGLVGDDFFIDLVHPNLRAHRRIADAIAERLAREGLPLPQERWHIGVYSAPEVEELYRDAPDLVIQEFLGRAASCVVARRSDCALSATSSILELRPDHPDALRFQKLAQRILAH